MHIIERMANVDRQGLEGEEAETGSGVGGGSASISRRNFLDASMSDFNILSLRHGFSPEKEQKWHGASLRGERARRRRERLSPFVIIRHQHNSA